MCDLKVVSNNNVFYITGPDNAAKMQKRINADLFGGNRSPLFCSKSKAFRPLFCIFDDNLPQICTIRIQNPLEIKPEKR